MNPIYMTWVDQNGEITIQFERDGKTVPLVLAEKEGFMVRPNEATELLGYIARREKEYEQENN